MAVKPPLVRETYDAESARIVASKNSDKTSIEFYLRYGKNFGEPFYMPMEDFRTLVFDLHTIQMEIDRESDETVGAADQTSEDK